MFRKSLRKKLIERNWREIEKQESNPTQTWHRIRDQSVRAINDLTLLAKKLPEDKQKEIFSMKIIDDLVSTLLTAGQNPSPSYVLSSRKAELAAVLLERSINLIIFHYSRLERDTPSLIEPTVYHLKQSISICNDVSHKLRLKNVEEEAEQMEHRYLFSWNNMLGKEKNRLLDFILSKTANEPIQIIISTLKQKRREMQFSFELGDELSKEILNCTFQITLNNTNTSAKVIIFSNTHGVVWEGELLVKEAVNYYSTIWTGDRVIKPISDYNLFIRNNKIKKKRF